MGIGKKILRNSNFQRKIGCMKRIMHGLLLAIMCLFAYVFMTRHTIFANPIKTINSFNQIDFVTIKAGSLVIFDIDETLVQPTDTYSINEHSPQAIAFQKKMVSKHPEITNWDIYADILRDVQRPLLEPMVIKKIAELQRRGIPVITVTAMNTGKHGTIEKMEAWRYDHLASLGFRGSFADLMLDLPLKNHKPVFYKGILATDTLTNKGQVIFGFLDNINYVPKKIVMFDDTIEFLQSALQECRKRNIDFQGYLYTGAITKSWDEELIEFQAEYLIEHKKWLKDEEARALMVMKK